MSTSGAAPPVTLAAVEAIFGAKGQLLVGTGNGTGTRKAVGADGTILTADSTQADGQRWAAAPSTGLVTAQSILGVDTAYASGVLTSILTLPNLAAGTWLLACTAACMVTTSGFRAGVFIGPNGMTALTAYIGGASSWSLAGNQYVTSVTLATVVVLAAITTVEMGIEGDGSAGTAKVLSEDNAPGATQLNALKVA